MCFFTKYKPNGTSGTMNRNAYPPVACAEADHSCAASFSWVTGVERLARGTVMILLCAHVLLALLR